MGTNDINSLSHSKRTKERRDGMDAEAATNQKNMETQHRTEVWRKA